MQKEIVRNYYRIHLDDYAQDDLSERARVAILEAQDRTNLFILPCEWEVIDDDGYTVTVVRRHYPTQVQAPDAHLESAYEDRFSFD